MSSPTAVAVRLAERINEISDENEGCEVMPSDQLAALIDELTHLPELIAALEQSRVQLERFSSMMSCDAKRMAIDRDCAEIAHVLALVKGPS